MTLTVKPLNFSVEETLRQDHDQSNKDWMWGVLDAISHHIAYCLEQMEQDLETGTLVLGADGEAIDLIPFKDKVALHGLIAGSADELGLDTEVVKVTIRAECGGFGCNVIRLWLETTSVKGETDRILHLIHFK